MKLSQTGGESDDEMHTYNMHAFINTVHLHIANYATIIRINFIQPIYILETHFVAISLKYVTSMHAWFQISSAIKWPKMACVN